MKTNSLLWSFLLLSIVHIASSSFSSIELASHFGIDGNEATIDLESMGFDQYENIYLVGEFMGNTTLNGQDSYYYPDGGVAFLAKYDNSSEHSYLWSVLLASDYEVQVWVLETSLDGYTAFSGSFRGSIQFANATCTSTGWSDRDLFFVLYDTDGNEMFHKCFGSDLSDGMDHAISIGNDSSVYATGKFQGIINFGGDNLGNTSVSSVYVAKFTFEGEHVWSLSYPSQGSFVQIAFDNFHDNAVILAGYYFQAFELNGAMLPEVSSNHALVLKLAASDGSYIWHQAFNSNSSQAEFCDVDTDGSIIVVGESGPFSLGDVSLSNENGTTFILKLSSDGEAIWGEQLNSDLDLVKIGYQNTFFVGGGYYRTNLTLGVEENDVGGAYVAAFTTDGEFLWISSFNASDAYVWGLHTVPSTKTVVRAGSFYGSNVTIDGISYSATEGGVFVQVYNGTYTEDSSSSDGGHGFSTGVLVAIIVGAAAAAAIIGIVAALVIRKRKRGNGVV